MSKQTFKVVVKWEGNEKKNFDFMRMNEMNMEDWTGNEEKSVGDFSTFCLRNPWKSEF